jgi:diguanylate cyclase (GGDEF)-like protein
MAADVPEYPTSLPNNEQLRLAAIRHLDILDTPPDGAFDRLTQLAGRVFKVPIAIVTVVDTDRIWFKSKLGLDVDEVPLSPGLCASCILQDEVMVLQDARKDAVALTNPLVAGEFGLRFYAGAPLKTSNGVNIGTFCLIDRASRDFGEDERASLADFAAIVMEAMEYRLASRKLLLQNLRVVEDAEKKANTDAMTGLGNRRALESAISRFESVIHSGSTLDMMVAVVDLNGLKQINDRRGHAAGDFLIVTFAAGLKNALRAEDHVYRIGGDEFAILSPVAPEPDFTTLRSRIEAVTEDVRKITGFGEAGASMGISAVSAAGFNVQKALDQADRKMYEEKKRLSP